jgi:hypothetical protein
MDDSIVTSRLASDSEVMAWQEDGWILIEGLVSTEEIDPVAHDLREIFPTAEELHADPDGVIERWKGHPIEPKELFVWPDEGPGFRPEQQRWSATFPFPGMALNRLCVHPSIVDFAERALGSTDIRLYQAGASAKYAGVTNYEQPMHIDRNHSWLPPGSQPPWWNLEGFLYLSDIFEADNPTRLVSVRDSDQIDSPYGVVMPNMEPGVYAAERPAPGRRGSYLAYRSDCWHRGAPFGSCGCREPHPGPPPRLLSGDVPTEERRRWRRSVRPPGTISIRQSDPPGEQRADVRGVSLERAPVDRWQHTVVTCQRDRETSPSQERGRGGTGFRRSARMASRLAPFRASLGEGHVRTGRARLPRVDLVDTEGAGQSCETDSPCGLQLRTEGGRQ